MGADIVYETLRPFHHWAQLTAMCALVLATAAWVLLSLSSRGSSRWWLGMGFFILCLGAVAFGERSRMAAADLRPIALCLADQVSGCEVWRPWMTDAVDRVNLLGPVVVVIAALGLIAALATLFVERRTLAQRVATGPRIRALALLVGVVVAGIGTFLTADGVASWIEFAPLAGSTDGLGLIPLFNAIFGTMVGVVVLATGLILALRAALVRETPRQPELAS
jgi:hypothetical protein